MPSKDGSRKRSGTLSSSQNKAESPEQQSSRRRSLRPNMPSFSTMIKSTSLRSLSSDRPQATSRRQSLSRATASSQAKMAKFSSPHATDDTATAKKPSKFNKFLKRHRNSELETNTTVVALPSPPETPRTSQKRASWSPFSSLDVSRRASTSSSSLLSIDQNPTADQASLSSVEGDGVQMDPENFLDSTKAQASKPSPSASLKTVSPRRSLPTISQSMKRSSMIVPKRSSSISSRASHHSSSFHSHNFMSRQPMCEACNRRAAARRRPSTVCSGESSSTVADDAVPKTLNEPALKAQENKESLVTTSHLSSSKLDDSRSPSEETEPAGNVRPLSSCLAIMNPIFQAAGDGDVGRAALVSTVHRSDEQVEEDDALVELVASCLAHADKLERLAHELSRSEDRVNELLAEHQKLIQSLDARECRYKAHVATYQRLLWMQSCMLQELEDVLQRPIKTNPVVWMPSLLSVRARWEASRVVGGAVGTGAIVSQQLDERGYTTDLVVAGTCVTKESRLLEGVYILSEENEAAVQQQQQQQQSVFFHHYLLHMPREERGTRFVLCPLEKWVPDNEAPQCQLGKVSKGKVTCSTEFNLFQRRHHCRRCGHIFCQEHSANRLLLFQVSNRDKGEWARVCDVCFYGLVGRQSS